MVDLQIPENAQLHDVNEVRKSMGIFGLLNSIAHSFRHTHKIDRLVLGNSVIVEIQEGATLDLESRFVMGVLARGPVHPSQAKSYLQIYSDARLNVPSGGFARIGPGSTLTINRGTFTMGDSFINCSARIFCEDEITIGDDCAIGWDVDILDSDRHQIIYSDGTKGNRTAPVTIQDEVWIGHSVSIQKGVTIGEGSVIGSNSVVSRDIPPGVLAVGQPAEVVRENVTWEM